MLVTAQNRALIWRFPRSIGFMSFIDRNGALLEIGLKKETVLTNSYSKLTDHGYVQHVRMSRRTERALWNQTYITHKGFDWKNAIAFARSDWLEL